MAYFRWKPSFLRCQKICDNAIGLHSIWVIDWSAQGIQKKWFCQSFSPIAFAQNVELTFNATSVINSFKMEPCENMCMAYDFFWQIGARPHSWTVTFLLYDSTLRQYIFWTTQPINMRLPCNKYAYCRKY